MTLAPLTDRLASRRSQTILKAVSEAVLIGDRGERAMQAAWERASPFGRIMMVAALGDRHHHAGPADALIREAVRTGGPGTQDLRCASLTALANRLGPDATPTAVAALSQPNAAVRDYAIHALAIAGDGRGWDAALVWFSKYRPGHNQEPTSLPALSYLIRTLPDQPPGSDVALVNVIRKQWQALVQDGVANMLLDAWPDAAPEGPKQPRVPLTSDIGGVNWPRHPLWTASEYDWNDGG